MGATPSIPYNLNLSYFSLTFSGTDSFRLIQAPKNIIELTEQILQPIWKPQEINRSPGLVEFKLFGNPIVNGGAENMDFKYFLCTLIKIFYEQGWHVDNSVCLLRYGETGSTVLFRNDAPLQTYVACLSLDKTDQINLLGPENIVAYLREVIARNWPLGIQREREFNLKYKSHQFKLKGKPWFSRANILYTSEVEEFPVPQLMCEILKMFYRLGWKHVSSIQVGIKLNALYFKYDPEILGHNLDLFAVSLKKTDLIRVVNAPAFINELVRSAITTGWCLEIQQEQAIVNSYEFKLKGNPWTGDSNEAVFSKRLVNKMIEIFKQNSFDLCSICDLSYDCDKVSTFFFNRASAQASVPPKILSMSLNQGDKIRIIDDKCDFGAIVRDCLAKNWIKGIQAEKEYFSAYEFKLNGNPFLGNSQELVDFNIFVLVLLDYINKKFKNIKFIGGADLSAKYIKEENSSTTKNVSIHTLLFESY